MSDLIIPQHDKGYDIEFTIKDNKGEVVDLTTYTVTAKVWRPGYPGTLIVDKACTKDDAEAGECSYSIEADVFADSNDLKLKIALTKEGVILKSKTYDLVIEEAPE
jgi:hypothetical protein